MMKILVSGATGFIGSHLVPYLTAQGHAVTILTRSASIVSAGSVHPPSIQWDPARGVLNPQQMEGFDAVVHLAGDPIAHGRWTPEKKRRIRDSRVQGTKLLSETLAKLSRPPKVLVCASAIGYYGDRGSELVNEESPVGTGFLAETGVAWEQAAQPAAQKGIRVVYVRIGIVLSGEGGALKMMLPPFQMGVGGILGNGRQYMSWVSLDDLVGIIHHALQTESLRGPANAVAPQPVTNREFTKTLGKVIHRPTLFPVPPFALRALFGEMADAALLASTRVEPKRVLNSGYRFQHPQLEGALRKALNRN